MTAAGERGDESIVPQARAAPSPVRSPKGIRAWTGPVAGPSRTAGEASCYHSDTGPPSADVARPSVGM